jgi:hypothetical protein
MAEGEWYDYAVSRLQEKSKVERNGERSFNNKTIRLVLGRRLRLPREVQGVIVQELIDRGRIKRSHHQKYVILE